MFLPFLAFVVTASFANPTNPANPVDPVTPCEQAANKPVSIREVAERLGLNQGGRQEDPKSLVLRARATKESQVAGYEDTHFRIRVSYTLEGFLELSIDQIRNRSGDVVGRVAFSMTNRNIRMFSMDRKRGDFEFQVHQAFTPHDQRTLNGFEFSRADLAVSVRGKKISGLSLIPLQERNGALRVWELNGFREISDSAE